jgi:hypothetical protein
MGKKEPFFLIFNRLFRFTMKQFFTSLLLVALHALASAQVVDTLLFENFQVNKFPEWATLPTGNDLNWVSYDEDGLQPFDLDNNHRAWYHGPFFYKAENPNSGEVNYCATSFSWMKGFAPGNRNWLITPPIHVSDNNLVLHWKSAPSQMPYYMDGCLVMAGVGSNNVAAHAFTDTLFQAASMTGVTGDGNSTDLSNFSFTPGYIHNGSDYGAIWSADDATLLHSYLEPHSVSLAQYVGKTIYLAFLHNSDDDYFFAIDDVLVSNSTATATSDATAQDFRFVTYPNPVDNWLNVLYRLPEAANVAIRVSDMQGKVVLSSNTLLQQAGEQQTNLNLGKLPAGSYTVSLQIGEQVLTKMLLKK